MQRFILFSNTKSNWHYHGRPLHSAPVIAISFGKHWASSTQTQNCSGPADRELKTVQHEEGPSSPSSFFANCMPGLCQQTQMRDLQMNILQNPGSSYAEFRRTSKIQLNILARHVSQSFEVFLTNVQNITSS